MKFLVGRTGKRREFCQVRWKSPPSPRGWPLLGNVSIFAGSGTPYEKLRKVADDHGDVVTIHLGPVRMLILSSSSAVREAFVKNAQDFAGRPLNFTLSLLSRNGCGIAFADYSESWKAHKRATGAALRQFLSPSADGDRHPEAGSTLSPDLAPAERAILSEALHLREKLSSLVDRPLNPSRQLTIAILNVVCALTFGRRYDDDDPELWAFVDSNKKLKEIFQPGHPVDIFPALKIFPWKRLQNVVDLRTTRDTILQREYDHHLTTLDQENIRDFTDTMLVHGRDHNANVCESTLKKPLRPRASGDDLDDHPDVHMDDGREGTMKEDEVVMAMWEVFAGGFESTLQTMRWAMAYLVHYPQVQSRLWMELARVLPSGTAPRWSDRSRLPYLHAAVLEILRHSSLSSLNGVHRVTRDTRVGGYDVAKDTVVFCNLWWIHHDPRNWKDPDNFNPDNFLDKAGKVHVPRHFMPFSIGLRTCLGDKLAKMSLFVNLGMLVQAFTFEPTSARTPPKLTPTSPEPIRIIDEYEIVLRSRPPRRNSAGCEGAESLTVVGSVGQMAPVRETG
ncbi:steroid 17-alpha-hydroxylase/17,20 lyase-like [Diadema setosum]|uniref:steroid 17-alpha-hydroxylase/17,20 lyase-like n=1 Tax=Diadema setosum TaxID=31175 RepID=UPI003B3B81F2